MNDLASEPVETSALRAPFPYFGGKQAVADVVWKALGQPDHYIEPFFGSGAVLLSRPDYDANAHLETVNDADAHLCNVWRALQADPDAVAKVCDRPVDHAELMARKRVLVANNGTLLERLVESDEFYDVKLAGYWIWSASCWIGHGLTRPGQRPHVGHSGNGVHARGQIPNISDYGNGVHARGQIPHVSDFGKGVQDQYNTPIYEWFRRLSERLRNVRTVCGDWTRVCGGNWQTKIGTCGIFFDPPYADESRRDKIYHVDSMTVAHSVRDWCLRRGIDRDMRIVLAGYYDEHASLLEHGWTVHRWSAQGGYGNLVRSDETDAVGKQNRHKEALFFSPHCLKQADITQLELF